MTRNTLAALLLCLAWPAAADENPSNAVLDRILEGDRSPKLCLSIGRFRNTAVVDDQTILFFRRQDVWLNVLRRACPGLKPGSIFAYQVHGRVSRLCGGDLIFPAPGGIVCTLGKFYVITPAQARALQHPIEQWALDNAVGIEAVEPTR